MILLAQKWNFGEIETLIKLGMHIRSKYTFDNNEPTKHVCSPKQPISYQTYRIWERASAENKLQQTFHIRQVNLLFNIFFAKIYFPLSTASNYQRGVRFRSSINYFIAVSVQFYPQPDSPDDDSISHRPSIEIPISNHRPFNLISIFLRSSKTLFYLLELIDPHSSLDSGYCRVNLVIHRVIVYSKM